ncbi:hypothetical protein [Clostridium intestinale]|uniref:DUF2933 domain-containing protein n=1 Tax=Clostridium intestinale URNW TaxID=1294142 RepID=U2NTB1_9CLOT|nr:hypothetical protein [Clostridium intestinale]ERK32423.1 hypothetical protein CINTURNW_0153 [Clostridium intestinale URNW]
MNFNKSNKKNGKHNHSPLKHMLHMALCCGLPIIILSFLPLISRLSPRAGVFVSGIIPFICPLMMLGMIPMMLGGDKKRSCCSDSNKEEISKLDKSVD